MAHRRLILAVEYKRADNGPRTGGIREVANESRAGGHNGQRAGVAVRGGLVPASEARAAFATAAVAQAQDIRVVDVPLVTGAPIQFNRLPWPSTPFLVQRMVQDDYGFLWLSAADGLRRYDGYGLMRVPDSQNPKSIGYIIGQSLTKDRSGRIWIGADDSLNLYDPVTGSFQQYRSPNEACGTVAIAHDINEDQDGLIWLATDDGITALDPVTSKTTCYQPRYTPSIGEKRVIATLPSRDGTLWITSSEGLYTLDRRSGKVTRHIRLETSSGRKFGCTGFPAKPFQDTTGTMWVGLSSGGDLASINLASGDNYGLFVPGGRIGAQCFVRRCVHSGGSRRGTLARHQQPGPGEADTGSQASDLVSKQSRRSQRIGWGPRRWAVSRSRRQPLVDDQGRGCPSFPTTACGVPVLPPPARQPAEH